jgi:uncharacterized iron-regulated protein
VAALVAAVLVLPAAGADVIIVGEIHDNPHHHARQAEIAAAERPAAIVFEMVALDRTDALRAAVARGDTVPAIAAALDWEGSGWPDLGLYAPIWQAAPGARLYGAGLDRAAVRAAIAAGPETLLGPELSRLGLERPPGPDARAGLEAEMQAAHCGALPPEALARMVEAQQLRDAALAVVALRALAETGGPVLVIAGNGHARRDRGVPALIAAAEPALSVLAIGQGEDAAPDPDAPFDRWLVSPPVERPDPCEALRKG